MKRCLSSIVLGCAFAVLAIGTTSFAVSTVTVGSAIVAPGQQDVVIPVFLKNEVDLRAVTMPLMIRKRGPAYVDEVQMGIGDRMAGVLSEIAFLNHYNQGEEPLGECKRIDPDASPPTPGGYRSTPDYAGPEKQVVTGIPYGIMFVRSRLFGPAFPAGWDKTGSFLITADIGADEGCFEIDTTCMAPYIHPLLAKLLTTTAEPFMFSQGTIHVGACAGTVLGAPDPASLSPADGTTGPLDVTLSWGAVPEAGAYEIEIDTVDENFSNLVAKVTVQGTEYSLSIAEGETIYWRVRAVPVSCDYCFGDWANQSNASPVAIDDDMGARAGVTLYVVGAGVLTNDSDPDGDSLTAILSTGTTLGALDLHADGSFFYSPHASASGIDQFTYFSHDGQTSSATPATVRLHIKGSGAVPPGDYDEDGDLTALDLGAQIDAIFANGPDPKDGGCRDWPRGDLDCDGFSTAIDVAKMIDHLFAGGPGPCDPCSP